MITSVLYLFISKGGIHKPLLNHGVCGRGLFIFFASSQVASVGYICSVIVYFLHCISVCECDSCHKSLVVLSHSVMIRRSHLLARCYLGTMCMCMTMSWVVRRSVGHCVSSSSILKFHHALALICELVLVILCPAGNVYELLYC